MFFIKKILLFIILLINIPNISAKTYYSPYSEYSNYQIEPIISTDTTKVNTQKRYKLYLENIQYEYLPNSPENKHKRLEEYLETVSEWTEKEPEEQLDRTINTKTIYQYQESKKIRYLHFYDMYGTSNKLIVSEIQIFDKDNQLINYNDICTNCDKTYYETNRYRLKDNNYHSVSLYFKQNEILTLDLKEYYAMDDITIRIYLYDNNINTIKHFKIKYTQEENFDSNEYAISSIDETFEYQNLSSMEPFDYDINSITITNIEYDDIITTEEHIDETKLRKVESYLLYQTIDKTYKYEIIERQYLDEFYSEPFDNYQLDETTETTFYRAQTRDKVIITDNLIIDNYDINLYNLIELSTVDDIQITSNIDLYRNGLYQINFILPWKTITEDITVNIEENYLLALQEQNNTIKELEHENNILYKQINKFSADIKELLTEKDNEINEVNEKLIEYQYEIKELAKNKKEPKETIVKTDTKKHLLIIPIVLIIVLIIIIFKNLSNQNNN